jgi:hypothetical protein
LKDTVIDLLNDVPRDGFSKKGELLKLVRNVPGVPFDSGAVADYSRDIDSCSAETV